MLDIQFIREHADIVKESQRKRGESVELVDEVLRSDETRRSALKEFEEARAQQKEIGKKVAAAPADEKAALIAQTKELSAKVAEYKAAADAAAGEYTTAMWKLSNVVEPEAPEGGEDDYVVVKKVGQPRDFAAEGFEPKDHLTLGTGVAGIDMRRGVKVGGSRFYFLRGAVARMQIAMLTMAVDQAEKHGFVLAITPTLVRPEVMAGTGFLNSHADEIYRLREPDEQYLVGTSEVALAGMHENEILDLSNGPLRYCGWSSCYRREAGAAGKDTSGIIRVHQFDKVEMFVYTKQEDSYKEHQHLLKAEFPVDIHSDEATFEIQFGNVTRKVHTNTSWDKARFESCGQKWMDFSEGHYGVSLLNDCKYGHSVRDGVIGLTLIKCGVEPNPNADVEMHTFTYALFPHAGTWKEAGTVEESYQLNLPAYAVRGGQPGTAFSYTAVEPRNVVLETVKQAENGDGVVLRMYECENARTKTVVRLPEGAQRAYLTNLLEEIQEELPIVDGKVTFMTKPFEIQTVLVK